MIIGTDAFFNLNSWYMAEELKKLVHFVVFPREGSFSKDGFGKFKSEGWDFEITDFEMINISSTEIRNKSIKSDGTNKIIEDYIQENGLYKN
jgi:nicotinic acid mononucleotide adenylyltransferase